MDRMGFVKRFYGVAAGGGFVLFVLGWVFIRHDVTLREFAIAVLIWWVVMFVFLFRLIRSRQRSDQENRKTQIASGVPTKTLDREQCVRNIRIMKRLAFVFAILFACVLLPTQGDALLPRLAGASFDLALLVGCLVSLTRSRKKLRAFEPDSSGPLA